MTDFSAAIAAAREELDDHYTQGGSLDPQPFRVLLAALDAAQPAAWLAVDCIDERYLCFTEPKSGALTFKEVVPLYLAPVAVPEGYVPVSMLVEAREQVESWSAYAEPYFKDKWDLAGTLAKMDAQIAAARRGFERGLAARKPDRIWQDRNGALRTSPADCQSFGADGWPIAVYYGSQRFPISQHPLTEEDEP